MEKLNSRELEDSVLLMLDMETLDTGISPVVTELSLLRFDIDKRISDDQEHRKIEAPVVFHSSVSSHGQVQAGLTIGHGAVNHFWLKPDNIEKFRQINVSIGHSEMLCDVCVDFTMALLQETMFSYDELQSLEDEEVRKEKIDTLCKIHERMSQVNTFDIALQPVILGGIIRDISKAKLRKNFRICVNHAFLSDASWLYSMFKVCGWETMPFMFYSIFDISVLVDLGKWIRGVDPKNENEFVGTVHDSKDDCWNQIAYCQDIYAALKGEN